MRASNFKHLISVVLENKISFASLRCHKINRGLPFINRNRSAAVFLQVLRSSTLALTLTKNTLVAGGRGGASQPVRREGVDKKRSNQGHC